MECQLAPSVSETSLSPLSEVKTISSDVPMMYGRRVHFLEPILKSNSTFSLAGKTTDMDQLHGDEKEAVRRRKKSRPLAQIGPLAVTSLCQKSDVQSNNLQAQALKPSIEIRLRRPRSLHDVSGEVTATNIEQLSNDIDKFNAKSASPAVRRLNRWHLAKKLTRFASSPSLFNDSDTRKAGIGVVDPLSRSPTNSGSTPSPKNSPETRRPASEFFNRFMKKRTKTLARSKPLHIEIFKTPSIEETQTQDTGTGNIAETIELEHLKNGKGSKPVVVAEVHVCQSSDAPKVGNKTENSSSSSLPSSRRSSSSSNCDHRVRAQLLMHFTSHLPPSPGTSKPYSLIKDATNVHPIKESEVLITDILSNKMVLFDSHGMPKVSFALDESSEPWASCLTSDGTLAVTLRRLGCVSLWSLSGTPLSEFGHGILVAPTGIQVDSQDRFVVTDEKSNKVSIFNRQGQFVLSFVQPRMQSQSSSSTSTTEIEYFRFDQPRYVCITGDGHYAVTDSANHCVRIFDSTGSFSHRIGSFGQKDGQFRFPYGVASDNAGLLYVADHFNNRISTFTIKGDFQFHALTCQDGITRPKGLAIHNFHLYVTYGNLRAGKISVYNLPSRQFS